MTMPSGAPALVRFGARAPRRRLFCLPFAGGGVAPYRAWAPLLPVDVELAAVQLPGRESRMRERSFDAIAPLVEAVHEVIAPVLAASPEMPYALFGHSMGALVAFELACALGRAAEAGALRAPDALFVSARRAPDEPDHVPPVHHLPEAVFLDALQERYGAIPDAVRQEPELLALLVPALRADIGAIETYAYTPGRIVACAVAAYGGTEDRHPVPAQLAGWQRVCAQPVRVRTFPGDHFYLTTQREALVRDLVATWDRLAAPAVA